MQNVRRDAGGQPDEEYEPYIFSALNSARVMPVPGAQPAKMAMSNARSPTGQISLRFKVDWRVRIYCLVTASWQNLMICVGLGAVVVLALVAVEGLLMLMQALRHQIGRFLRS